MIRNLLFSIALLVGLSIVLSACDADSQLGAEHDYADGTLADARSAKVEVASICEGIWSVTNSTSSGIDFGWSHQSSSTSGAFAVPKSVKLYFRTGHVSGDRNRLRYTVNGKNAGHLDSNNKQCTYTLTGRVYNVTDSDLLGEDVSDGIRGLELVLENIPGKSSTTNASGVYSFDGLSFGEKYLVNWGTGGNTSSITPYYTVQAPVPFPFDVKLTAYPGLEDVGKVTETLVTVQDVKLLLNPADLRKDFEEGNLERDDNDDHFWWEQFNRALGGDGGQNNAVVKRSTLLRLLNLIEFGGDGIDPFYADPFTFGEGDNNRLQKAYDILQPPDNRNTPQRRFESALLTVWLNRVYDTRINTALLDGLLLGAENAYRLEYGQQLVTPQITVEGTTVMGTYSATSSLDEYETTLTSTYRSGSGGIGSN
jgi:hypothetical protein